MGYLATGKRGTKEDRRGQKGTEGDGGTDLFLRVGFCCYYEIRRVISTCAARLM